MVLFSVILTTSVAIIYYTMKNLVPINGKTRNFQKLIEFLFYKGFTQKPLLAKK